MSFISPEIIIAMQQLEGIGNKTIMKIIDLLPSGTELHTLDDLQNFWVRLKGKKISAITPDQLRYAYNKAYRIIAESDKQVIHAITYYDDVYPEILRKCVDEEGKPAPPLVLYYRGDLNVLEMPGIAVIGTREPTPNGQKAGEYFAGEFAKNGYNIVSGLAIGCDTCGHRGALKVGGVTTAFLADGLDWNSIYPKENLELAQNIVYEGGLLMSEYPIGQSCGRYGLVARDRLQAGLSVATLVVQTGIRGGTMHAVNATLAAGKPLFAVEYSDPFDVNNDKVQGNRMLISTGKAKAMTSKKMPEILNELATSREQKRESGQQLSFDFD